MGFVGAFSNHMKRLMALIPPTSCDKESALSFHLEEIILPKRGDDGNLLSKHVKDIDFTGAFNSSPFP